MTNSHVFTSLKFCSTMSFACAQHSYKPTFVHTMCLFNIITVLTCCLLFKNIVHFLSLYFLSACAKGTGLDRGWFCMRFIFTFQGISNVVSIKKYNGSNMRSAGFQGTSLSNRDNFNKSTKIKFMLIPRITYIC